MELKPGDIILVSCPWIRAEHDKFLVTLSTEPVVLFAYINSEINSFIEKRPELKARQVVIDCASHTFLNYDSYIDVPDVFERNDREFQRIIQQLVAEPRRHKGRCSAGVLRKVLVAANQSETISAKVQASIKRALLPYVR